MRDLLGKLTAIDPQASEALQVVGYFDALTARGVGLGGLLRAAAALAGTVAGAEVRGRTVAYAADGRRIAEAGDASDESQSETRRRSQVRFRFGSVWLERAGDPHASDAMITERLALAVEALESRQTGMAGVEVVVDADRSAVERGTALAELRIDPAARVRVVLSAPSSRLPRRRSALVPSPCGVLLTSIDLGGGEDVVGPAGIGTWVRADHAPESWQAAIIAYRLIGEDTPDVIDATDLGAMLVLATAYDPGSPHPDVLALAELDEHSRQILRTLVDAGSLRAAATRLGMHHSTLQSRHESLSRELGYDPRSTSGRMRYIAAEFLRRLSS